MNKEENLKEEETVLSEDISDEEEVGNIQDLKEVSDSLQNVKKPEEVVSDVEIIEEVSEDDEVNKLYSELYTYIEKEVEISTGSGAKAIIPTGVDVLDAILGGGFAVGAMSVITSLPGCGKSTLAGQVIASAQKLFSYKSLNIYIDSEHATTTSRLAALGVLKPKLKPYVDVTVEKVFKLLEGICLFKNSKKLIEIPNVVVWDSVANTLSQKEKETIDPNTVIGYKARLLSLLIPNYVEKCSSYNIAFIVVNQLRDQVQIGNFAPAKDLKFLSGGKTMPGGNTLKFNAFHLLELAISTKLTSDMYGFDGFKVTAKCAKNKIFPINIPVTLIFDHNRGFSNFWTNYEFLKEAKRLTAGAWNYLTKLPDKKFRTKDVLKIYNEDEDFRNTFDEEVNSAIKTDIIEKYGLPS